MVVKGGRTKSRIFAGNRQMNEVSYKQALEFARSLPVRSSREAMASFPDLDANEQLVLRIALDLFARMEIKKPKSFLDGIFITGNQNKHRDFASIKPLLVRKKRVLDAGCGWGGLSRMLLYETT
jgi:2-polyprenyl-3-methyl-5-hydroxy-6-metoxy-1,4-benzoquinol methylase